MFNTQIIKIKNNAINVNLVLFFLNANKTINKENNGIINPLNIIRYLDSIFEISEIIIGPVPTIEFIKLRINKIPITIIPKIFLFIT